MLSSPSRQQIRIWLRPRLRNAKKNRFDISPRVHPGIYELHEGKRIATAPERQKRTVSQLSVSSPSAESQIRPKTSKDDTRYHPLLRHIWPSKEQKERLATVATMAGLEPTLPKEFDSTKQLIRVKRSNHLGTVSQAHRQKTTGSTHFATLPC